MNGLYDHLGFKSNNNKRFTINSNDSPDKQTNHVLTEIQERETKNTFHHGCSQLPIRRPCVDSNFFSCFFACDAISSASLKQHRLYRIVSLAVHMHIQYTTMNCDENKRQATRKPSYNVRNDDGKIQPTVKYSFLTLTLFVHQNVYVFTIQEYEKYISCGWLRKKTQSKHNKVMSYTRNPPKLIEYSV